MPTVIDWIDLLDRDDILIFDCETTGLKEWSECVEIGIIDTTGAERLHSHIMPVGDISPDASAVHGYTRERLEEIGAPGYGVLHDNVIGLFEDATIVLAYNAVFDSRLLHQTAGQHGLSVPDNPEWRCIMLDYAEYRGEIHPYYGNPRWHKLSEAAQHEGVTVGDMAHSAVGDCSLTLGIMRAVSSKSSQ